MGLCNEAVAHCHVVQSMLGGACFRAQNFEVRDSGLPTFWCAREVGSEPCKSPCFEDCPEPYTPRRTWHAFVVSHLICQLEDHVDLHFQMSLLGA